MKVSVLTITYNHEKYIAQAIESALNQDVTFDYEIIVGEDYSTDGTRTIVRSFSERYPTRIRLFLPNQNLGAGGNRIFAHILQMAQGEYLAYLDGDDYWTSPHKLQKQVDFLDSHPECSMCFHNVLVSDEAEGSPPYPFNSADQKQLLSTEDLLAGNLIQSCSAMIRRSALPCFPEWLYSLDATDWALYILASLHGSVGYLNDVMGIYRRHHGAMFYRLTRAEHLERAIHFYEQFLGRIGSAYDEIVRRERSKRMFDLAMAYEQAHDFKKSGDFLERCISDHPLWLEGYVPEVGYRGARIWKALQKRLWLYHHPFLLRPALKIELIKEILSARLIVFWLFIRKLRDLLKRKHIRWIVADPNPIASVSRSGLGKTTLSWAAAGAEALEVHVGAPDGPLLSRSASCGTAVTGEWIHDRMLFYLQDVSTGKPLTFANTIDVIQVRVIKNRKASRH